MNSDSPITWMSWSELPWFSQSETGGAAIHLSERLLGAALELEDTKTFLHEMLPQLATEFAVQWVGVLEKANAWTLREECGRFPLEIFPEAFFNQVAEMRAGGFQPMEQPAGWGMIGVPLVSSAGIKDVFVFCGRNLTRDWLPMAVVVGRAFGLSLRLIESRELTSQRAERLRSTLEMTSSFAKERKSGRLLGVIATEATRLLDCDRSSIFVWDREQHELVACPALGVEGETLRIPETVGIVGEVVAKNMTIKVDNAYKDPRFHAEVDKQSGYKTRNLVCVPVHDADGRLIGAFECINKNRGSFSDEDVDSLKQLGMHAATAIRNTREWEQLIRTREQLTEQIREGVKLIGQSPAIAALRATVERLAATDLPVLLLGESGTGKEVVAQALHYQGPRGKNPFIAVNCAALSETLLESELFGHEKGSFTDARETRQGKFELADGGTLFLDEIGDMSLGGQAKLLRVLEQKVIARVGGSQSIPIDVRIVAATNANLAEAVRNKKFREDLYYRLSVVTQVLPPLRDRPEDILLLAEYFLKHFCVQARRPSLQLSAEARRRLQSHSWPGNVRELRNLMERVAFLSRGERVEADDLAFILSPDHEGPGRMPAPNQTLKDGTRDFQQTYIRLAIKRAQGNMSQAAEMLGLHRSNLYRKMRQLDMEEAGDEE
jgi:Nif-specific regulatory protein